MPHIPLQPDFPGIRSLVAYRTDTGPAFSMYSRYVDELATWAPSNPEACDEMGRRMAEEGYPARFDRVVGASRG